MSYTLLLVLSFAVMAKQQKQQREQYQQAKEEVDLTSQDEEVVKTISLLNNVEDKRPIFIYH